MRIFEGNEYNLMRVISFETRKAQQTNSTMRFNKFNSNHTQKQRRSLWMEASALNSHLFHIVVVFSGDLTNFP